MLRNNADALILSLDNLWSLGLPVVPDLVALLKQPIRAESFFVAQLPSSKQHGG